MQTLSLRSEMEWMRLFPGKINITLKFHGFPGKDEVSFQSDSRATIKNLKDQICRQILNSDKSITGAKLRIRQMQNLALKDNFTLAFFNIPEGATLQVSLK